MTGQRRPSGLLVRGAGALRPLLDLLLPPRCLSCGETVQSDAVGAQLTPASLCAACWARLTFIAHPLCARCGEPFAFEDEAPNAPLCPACALAPGKRHLGRSRAALIYDDASKELVLGFKHADRTEAALLFARWLNAAGGEVLQDADLLVAVPLHRWRLFKRRYNQAVLLAEALAQLSGVPQIPDLMLRRRATPSQGTLGRLGRARNVAGAFAVAPRHQARVEGARIVVIDDVHTTGATLEECARVLLRAGARSVDALTVARVVRSG